MILTKKVMKNLRTDKFKNIARFAKVHGNSGFNGDQDINDAFQFQVPKEPMSRFLYLRNFNGRKIFKLCGCHFL